MGRLLQLVPYPNDIALQNVSLIGQGSAVDCLRDGSDASWVQMFSGGWSIIHTEIESPGLAGNERTVQGRWVVRWDTGNGNPDWYLTLKDPGGGIYFFDYETANRSGGLLTYAFPWHALYIDQNQLTDLRFVFEDHDGGTTKPRITSAHLEIETNYAPDAPSISGASGSMPETGPSNVSWVHSDPEGDAQTGAQLIIRRVDNGVDHWNQEYGTGTSQAFSNYTFPPGDYYCFVRTGDAYGWGPYATTTFNIPNPNTPPTVTATAPTGVQGIQSPTVTWTYSDLQGHPQSQYLIYVYSEATYTAGGFNPGITTPTWSPGYVNGTDTSRVIGVALASGTWRAYVWAKDSTGLQSSPSYAQFTVNLPPTPTVTAPSGTVSTTFSVIWTISDPESNAQGGYRMKVFHDSIYDLVGFNPEFYTSMYDTGDVVTGTASALVTGALTSGNCRAYVKVKDNSGSNTYGPWAYRQFIYNKRSTVVVSAPTGDIQNPSPTVQWNYSDPDGNPQTGFHLRIFDMVQYQVGAFDPTTATADYNTEVTGSAATSHLVTVELVSDTYRTYVRTKDSGSNEYGAWAFAAFVLNRSAAVIVTAPIGSTSVRRPLVTWTYTDPEGNAQQRFRVKLIAQAVYEGGSFSPETATAAYDSGDISSATTTHNTTTELAKGNYRAYVKATDTASGTYTNWSQASFTIQTHSHQMIL